MSDPATQRKSIRFCGRSFFAFVLTPEPPIYAWLANLDELEQSVRGILRRQAGGARRVGCEVEQLARSSTSSTSCRGAISASWGWRAIEQSELGPDLPPVLKGGRAVAVAEQPVAAPPDPQPPQQGPASLLLESPVRSGQSIVFPDGDITVLGSVASGAEVIAGGSIHIYGALRGRAFAGSGGNSRARIFCSKVEAELLAIDGLYRTADEIEAELRSQPIQAWLKTT